MTLIASYEKRRMPLWARIVISIFVSLAAIAVIWLGIYLINITNLYAADPGVSDFPAVDNVSVTEISDEWDVRKGSLIAPGGWFLDGPGTGTALIFYPEKRMDASGYLPLLHDLAENGIDCFLVKPLLSIPCLYKDSARYIMDAYEGVYEHWYIAGHGEGGHTAATYASEHIYDLTGLILLSSFPSASLRYGGFRVLSLYGTQDGLLDTLAFQKARSNMPGTYTESPVTGGNHTYFASCALMDGDNNASISKQQQQAETVQAILSFVTTGN